MPSNGLHGGGHHHGGGGGHHHGGGGGGGHHGHHGGGNWGGGYSPWYGGGGYYPIAPSCPFVYAPVLGSDGKVYDNECYCRAAGADVVRYLKPSDVVNRSGVSGLGLPGAGDPSWVLLTIAAIGLFFYLRRE